MYDDLNTSDDSTTVVTPSLTDRDVKIITAALTVMLDRSNWRVTDLEWDDLEDWISTTLSKVI